MALTKEDVRMISDVVSDVMDRKLMEMEERFDKKLEERLIQLKAELDQKMNEKLSAEFLRFENRVLLKLSDLVDRKMKAELDTIKSRLDRIELDLLENNVVPRIRHIEACYTSTYRRYEQYADKMDMLMMDMDIMKRVMLDDHSKPPTLCSE